VAIHEERLIIMARKRRGRSEGSIFFRESDNQWAGSVSLGYDGAGKRKRRTVYGASKQEVQVKLRELQSNASVGSLSDAGRLTVGDYLQRWLENTAKSKTRATTYARYEQLVRLHIKPILGGLQLSKLSTIHVESLYAEMERNGGTAWTRKMAGMVLTNALRHAVRLKLIPFNPAADVIKARPEEKEMLFLTDAQARLFLAAARAHRLHTLFVLAIGSGMRQGELLGLRWSDIDFEKSTVSVSRSLAQVNGQFTLKEPKSKQSRRTITLPRFVMEALTEHRAAMLAEGNIAAAVFCTRTGQYFGKSNLIRQVFRPILRRANDKVIEETTKTAVESALLPEIRFHDLRHTHATSLLGKGHSIKAVSQRLGHNSIEITLKTYAHVLPTDDAALAAGLDRLFG
jgi:integrase